MEIKTPIVINAKDRIMDALRASGPLTVADLSKEVNIQVQNCTWNEALTYTVLALSELIRDGQIEQEDYESFNFL